MPTRTFVDPTAFTVKVAVPASSTPAGVILPQTYGGVPDGTTNNYAALTRAMAAAATQRLPVFLGKGTWYADTGAGGWSGIAVPSGVEVYGETGTALTWRTDYSEDYPYFGINGGTSGQSIHDLTFVDGNGGNTINGPGGGKPITGVQIANLSLHGCALNSLFACVDSTIQNCTVDGSVEDAVTTAPMVAGTIYSSLLVRPLAAPIAAGTQLYVYADPTYASETFQIVYTSAAAPAGATTLPLKPVFAQADIPAGASARRLVVSTGIAMTGQYSNWNSAPGTLGSWVVNSAIKNCTVRNCMAANIFINMGYQCLIEGNYGSVGHDMNFDFEYCVDSTQQNNEGHFGGNRGCAVETVNSGCRVINNTIYDTTQDGIRVTTDYVPPGNTRNIGGHLVQGNTVKRAYRGIAIQGTDAVVQGNTATECFRAGCYLFNTNDLTSVDENTFSGNYGSGIELLNSTGVKIGMTTPNTATDNGYQPQRTAPALTVAAGSGSLPVDEYAVALQWGQDVYTTGVITSRLGAPTLPAFATLTAAGQVLTLDVPVPTGATTLAVNIGSKTFFGSLQSYQVPGGEDYFGNGALLLSCPRLGEVDLPTGTVTYANGVTAGLAVSVSAGVAHITISAPAKPPSNNAPSMTNDFTVCAGIYFNNDTGSVGAITMGANIIRGNGYAGVYGTCGGLAITGGEISTHTAAGVWAGNPAPDISGVTVSDSYLGLTGGGGAQGAQFKDCTLSALQEGIHFFANGGGQCWGFGVDGCTFNAMPVGIACNAYTQSVPSNRSGAAPDPGVVSNCTFTNVQTPVDTKGGKYDVITIGTGNVGV